MGFTATILSTIVVAVVLKHVNYLLIGCISPYLVFSNCSVLYYPPLLIIFVKQILVYLFCYAFLFLKRVIQNRKCVRLFCFRLVEWLIPYAVSFFTIVNLIIDFTFVCCSFESAFCFCLSCIHGISFFGTPSW